MKLEGKLSISRVSGSKNYIEIRLEDKKSHTLVTYIDVPIETFGAIITGLSAQPVEYETYDFNVLGKNMEYKTEQLFVECGLYDKEQLKDELQIQLKKYEIDGWVANISESLSVKYSTGTNKDGKKYVLVRFRRWV
jgi:hypothetical protein